MSSLPARPRPNPIAPAPSKPPGPSIVDNFLGLFGDDTPTKQSRVGERPVPTLVTRTGVQNGTQNGNGGTTSWAQAMQPQRQSVVEPPRTGQKLVQATNTTTNTTNVVLPVLTQLSLIKLEELQIDDKEIMAKLEAANAHLLVVGGERDSLAAKLQERDSVLMAQYEQTAKQLETLQNSVHFGKVNAMQSELNKLKEEKANLETRLVTANETNQVILGSVADWKKKADEALTSKRNTELQKSKLETSLAEANEELARVTEMKNLIDKEMSSVNLKIEEKVASVKADFELKIKEMQVKFENLAAERNNFAQRTLSLRKEVDKLLREARDKSTVEVQNLKMRISDLEVELDRKKKSLENVASMLNDSLGEEQVDFRAKRTLEDKNLEISGLKESQEKLRESYVQLVKQIEEYQATGKIRDLEVSNGKSKGSGLDTFELP